MDILLSGEGFGFKIAASTAQKEDKRHFFKLDKVSVHIDHMDIKLKKSKHKVLFNVFKPMLFSVVRPAIVKVVEKQISDAFVNGDEFAYDINREAKRAEEAAKDDPENKKSSYARHMDAFRAKMEAKKEAAKKKPKRDTKVQTTFSLHDSLFPNITLPGAVSTKATEYVDRARQGERWESPVFSLGTAKESSDIPKPASITRKSHKTDGGKLTEPTNGTNGAKADGLGRDGKKKGGKAEQYSTRGFADEVTSAIDSDGSKKTPKIEPNTAFNPQAA